MSKVLEVLWTVLWFSFVVYFCILGVLDFTFSRITCSYGYTSVNDNYFVVNVLNYTLNISEDYSLRATYKELGYEIGNTTGYGNNFIVISNKEYIRDCVFSFKK